MSNSTIVVGLETGTSKICAIVGEVGESGTLNVIGLGQAKSRGIRKGEITDFDHALEDIRNAIVEAEQMADVEIREVVLGVTGNHIRGFNNHGVHPIVSNDREISEADVQDVLKNAKAINLPAENNLIHVIRQHFTVDGQEQIQNPVGMVGGRLEVDVHVVHGHYNRLQNAIRAVSELQLQVADIYFNGLATSMAVLSPEQKEMGALVIDLGAGCTEYAVSHDGIVKHTGVLAVGGDHVSYDLACGLKVPLGKAEQLKISHGAALVNPAVRGETFCPMNQNGLPEKAINLEHLRMIMKARLEETFEIIADEIHQAGLFPHLRAGIFLCGGGARTSEVQQLAEQVFGLPVQLGRASAFSGLKSTVDKPEFATALGLLKLGATRSATRRSKGNWIRNSINSLWRHLSGRPWRPEPQPTLQP